MNIIENKEFEGERPLFSIRDSIVRNVTIHKGESSLKHCANIRIENSRFEGKYPIWHCNNVEVDGCFFDVGGRAAIWYTNNLLMTNTKVIAPKMFRDMDGIRLVNVELTDALETFWNCINIDLRDVRLAKGDYLFMHSSNINIENYVHQGNYSFQYCNNITIRNAKLDAKDAFWNSSNITVIDSEITGEYLGWHSRNLRLINCRISGTQPLCYAHDLVMENCTMAEDCDLAFEYSSVNAQVNGNIVSIKNPDSGIIRAGSVGEIIYDEFAIPGHNCEIRTGE